MRFEPRSPRRTSHGQQQSKLYYAFVGLVAFCCVLNILPSLVDISIPDEERNLSTRPDDIIEHNLDRRHKLVHVVVSHCNKPLSWIWNEFFEDLNERADFSIKSVTIITKCGIPVEVNDMPPPEFMAYASCDGKGREMIQPIVGVLELPNFGRCDHSYAYWIAQILQNGAVETETNKKENKPVETTHNVVYSNSNYTRCNFNSVSDAWTRGNTRKDPFKSIAWDILPTDLVLFIKDNNNAYRDTVEDAVPLKNMARTIFRGSPGITDPNNVTQPLPNGMACGALVNPKEFFRVNIFNWAHRSILWTFHLDDYDREKYDVANEADLPPDDFASGQPSMGAWIQHLASQSSEVQPVFTKGYQDDVVQRFDPGFQVPRGTGQFYRELDLVPMCFGGVFSIQWGQLSSSDAAVTPHGWSVISTALSRADNLEEGHFMERWWMDLVTWSSYSTNQIAAATSSVGSAASNWWNGYSGYPKYSILSETEQTDLLKRKKWHFKHPSPYVGLITPDWDNFVDSGVSHYSRDKPCLSMDYDMSKLLSKYKQVFIIYPRQANERSLLLFTRRCMDFNSFQHTKPANVLNRHSYRNKVWLEALSHSLEVPSLIASVMVSDENVIDVMKHATRDTLIIYSHREETDRLQSAVDLYVRTDLCPPAPEECVVKEEDVLRGLYKGFLIPLSGANLLTCKTYDSIEDNFPNMVLMNYRQADRLNTELAKHHCPEMAGDETQMINDKPRANVFVKRATSDEVAKMKAQVDAENAGEIATVPPTEEGAENKTETETTQRPRARVPLDDWLKSKKQIIEFFVNHKEHASCQAKTRTLEDELYSCPDELQLLSGRYH